MKLPRTTLNKLFLKNKLIKTHKAICKGGQWLEKPVHVKAFYYLLSWPMLSAIWGIWILSGGSLSGSSLFIYLNFSLFSPSFVYSLSPPTFVFSVQERIQVGYVCVCVSDSLTIFLLKKEKSIFPYNRCNKRDVQNSFVVQTLVIPIS